MCTHHNLLSRVNGKSLTYTNTTDVIWKENGLRISHNSLYEVTLASPSTGSTIRIGKKFEAVTTLRYTCAIQLTDGHLEESNTADILIKTCPSKS